MNVPQPHNHELKTTHRILCWPVGLIEVTAEVCLICGSVRKEAFKILKKRPDDPRAA